MKGLSIFLKNHKIRLHPNAYTGNSFGRAIPPFVILGADISTEELEQAIYTTLEYSQSDVPFKMITPEETQAYHEAFGTRQMGKGVHITLEKGQYTLSTIAQLASYTNAPPQADKNHFTSAAISIN